MEVEINNTYREKLGLVDGKSVILKCFSCGKKLLECKIVQPDVDVDWNIRADCPCGDSSEVVSLHGRFMHVPYEKLSIKSISSLGDLLIYTIGDENA